PPWRCSFANTLFVKCLANFFYKLQYLGHCFLLRRIFQFLDDAAAYHYRVRHGSNRLRGGRIAYAEAHTDRHLHVATDIGDALRHFLGIDVTGTGHALEGNVITEATAHL